MAMKGDRVILGQDGDFIYTGVQAIADRDIDEPVFAADGHGRLGAGLGERIEPGTLSAAHD